MTYSRHWDLLSAIGLLAAFQSCRRVIRGGFVWLGLPCSSFVWVSRGSTHRCRLRPKGSKRLRRVRMANRLTRRVCYLWLGGCIFLLLTFLQLFFCDCRICTFFSSLDVDHLRLEYLRAKGVHWCIEQPSSSLFPLYRPLEERVG